MIIKLLPNQFIFLKGYSLSVIFYELIAGFNPFEGETYLITVRNVNSCTPSPLHEICKDVPEEFGRAISQAMAKDLNNRLSSCEELISKLETALNTNWSKLAPQHNTRSRKDRAETVAAKKTAPTASVSTKELQNYLFLSKSKSDLEVKDEFRSLIKASFIMDKPYFKYLIVVIITAILMCLGFFTCLFYEF